jgi:hypothetical protein
MLGALAPDIGIPNLFRGLAPALVASGVMAAVLLVLDAGLGVEVPVGIAVFTLVWLPLARWWTPEQLGLMRSLIPGSGRHPSTPDHGSTDDTADAGEPAPRD